MNRKDLKLQVSFCLNFSESDNNSAYSHLRRLLMEIGIKDPRQLVSHIADDVEERITEAITQQIIKDND